MTRRILSLLLALLLVGSLAIAASAHDVPDYDRLGSISVSMTYKGKAVSGGTLTLVRVADVDSYDGDYFFTYTEDFKDCIYPVTALSSAELPTALAAIVSNKKITGVTKTLDKKGKTTFSDLEIGLYLLIQNKAASGYSKVSPFLVSVPRHANEQYVYDVDASPKVDVEPQPTTATTTPSSIPQTGQNNWPVPVLAVVGLLLFSGGWMLAAGGRKKKHET